MTCHSHGVPLATLPAAAREDPVIEALRGLAACMVMATHYAFMVTSSAGMWGFASTGVDLFFVLSGYVFAPYLLGRPLPVFSHLVRRFFRVVPLYWCALAAYVLLRFATTGEAPYVWLHLFFLHTTQSLEIAGYYNPAFWSLPPEVEYYLALPLLAWWAGRFRLFSLVALSLGLHLALVWAADPNSTAVTSRAIATVHLPGLLCEFSLGSFAYWWAQSATAGRQRAARLVLGAVLLSGVAWLYGAYIADTGIPRKIPVWIGGNIGLAAACAYAVIVSALAGGGQAIRPRVAPPFLLLGQCSYGIYLFHNATPQVFLYLGFTVKGWALLAASVAFTLAWAWLLHHGLEQPAREWGRNLSRRIGVGAAAPHAMARRQPRTK